MAVECDNCNVAKRTRLLNVTSENARELSCVCAHVGVYIYIYIIALYVYVYIYIYICIYTQSNGILCVINGNVHYHSSPVRVYIDVVS